MFSDLISTIVVICLILMATYAFYLFYKFYSKTSVKKIIVTEHGDAIITYQLLRNNSSREYKAYKDNIKIKTQKNRLWLLENGKPIAKVYKDTLQDKKDWDRIIDCYRT